MVESVPSGTVTFLFTDIEGSTRLWETFPEAMQSVLARHDAILRASVAGNRGRIVKTTGDGCHAAFETALEAIAAALTAQQALTAEPWQAIQPRALRVRMGMHSGEAEVRAGDYYGPAVNRAARLMSVGHGGQVLVSAAAAELARDLLPAESGLLDLGEHRLKDLVRPEHIFQLVHPTLPASFPPLKSLDNYPNNLPIQITSFIGREREIEEARRLLAAAHLVSFTGSGGTGKTRLALQVAAEILSTFADGAWLVELASLSDGGLVLPALAGALNLRSVPGVPLLNTVSEYLRARRILIILDNCEHLIDACAQLANHLLRTCPHLKILASSREGLGIAGEVSYRVPSLSLPSAEELTLELVGRCEAAQLFAERAAAANPHFALNAANVAAVAQVCRRLDGIPLALELAAARTKLFPAEQIAARLNDRFRLLTGGSRTALPRQQTLRAMIDWSYDLLSVPERALLRQLAVFSGGWSFEAAEVVCAELDVLSLLEQLVNKSLVVMEENQGQARYHMLETIRQYAREKLIEAGEGTLLRDRHLDYFLQLSEQAELHLRGSEAFDWIERLTADIDNIRAAAEWGQEARLEDALLLVGNLIFFWSWYGHDLRQTLAWLNNLSTWSQGLHAADLFHHVGLRARSRVFSTAGLLTMGAGDTAAAIDFFKEAIALERELGDPFYLAYALSVRSSLAMMVGDPESGRAAAEESVTLVRQMNDKRWLLICLPILASIDERQGKEKEAVLLRQEVRQYLHDADHPMFMTVFLGLGHEAHYRGHLEEAGGYFQEGIKIAQRLKSRYFATVMESELAHLARERGELQPAKEAYRRLIVTWKDFGQMAAVAHQLESFAMIAREEGETERSARLFGAAEAIRENIHIPRRGDEWQEYEQAVSALRGGMDPAVFTPAWADGRAMSIEQAIRFAIEPALTAEEIREDTGE